MQMTSNRIERLESALALAEKALTETVHRAGTGYDWNADPDKVTLAQGLAFTAIARAKEGDARFSFLEMVAIELKRATAIHGDMASHHEAYAVIQEELDEYWEMVKLKSSQRDKSAMLTELVQIAAMCNKAAKSLLDRP